MTRALLRSLMLILASLLVGCSSLSLGYNQAPRLAAWWIDAYLDLDRAQSRQLDTALQDFFAWHRREELPRLVTLLHDADQALSGGVSEPELAALEDQLTASLERCLHRAAPMAQPLLASLRPGQWQHLQATQAKRLAEWREEQAEPGRAADDFVKSLERGLGELEPALRRQARVEAQAWPAASPALWQARADRQATTVQALRAWASGDAAGGTALILRGTGRDPAHRPPEERQRRQLVTASLLRLLADPGAGQLALTRAQWAAWQAELRRLSRG